MDIIIFNKPFQVMSQFSAEQDKATLADYIQQQPGFYPAGRLDYDSEGLMILTNHGPLQHQLCHPDAKQPKTYWVQVEGQIDEAALTQLRQGLKLKDGLTRPALCQAMEPPADLWPRCPPIRQRLHIPTSWLSLTISEGRNRQVRRMTAAVGYPTLRLIRYAIGPWSVAGLEPGQWQKIVLSSADLPPFDPGAGRKQNPRLPKAQKPPGRHSTKPRPDGLSGKTSHKKSGH